MVGVSLLEGGGGEANVLQSSVGRLNSALVDNVCGLTFARQHTVLLGAAVAARFRCMSFG